MAVFKEFGGRFQEIIGVEVRGGVVVEVVLCQSDVNFQSTCFRKTLISHKK